ncbi:hypothetical protein JOB18_035984, partial [Solea senegalensis]
RPGSVKSGTVTGPTKEGRRISQTNIESGTQIFKRGFQSKEEMGDPDELTIHRHD